MHPHLVERIIKLFPFSEIGVCYVMCSANVSLALVRINKRVLIFVWSTESLLQTDEAYNCTTLPSSVFSLKGLEQDRPVQH